MDGRISFLFLFLFFYCCWCCCCWWWCCCCCCCCCFSVLVFVVVLSTAHTTTMRTYCVPVSTIRVRLLCERRPEARKKGDVDWEMFVRVLQSKGDMTEGEAAEKVQCAFRAFAARKLMATIRLEKLRASENKAVSMQTQQPQQPPPLLSSPTIHPSITHRATAIDSSSVTPLAVHRCHNCQQGSQVFLLAVNKCVFEATILGLVGFASSCA